MASGDKMWTLMMSHEMNVDGISLSMPIESFDTQSNTQPGSAKAFKRARKYTRQEAHSIVDLIKDLA